jgi:hypothetical protein
MLLILVLLLLAIASCDDNPVDPTDADVGSLTVAVPITAIAGEPFTVTITATGAGAADLDETVTLTTTAGTVSPTSTRMVGASVELDVTISDAAGTVTLTARAGQANGSGTIRSLAIRAFPGDSGDPVAEHTPRIRYTVNENDWSDDHPEATGMLISHNTMLVLPVVDATVGEINQLLGDLGAVVVGATPGSVGVAAGPLMVRLPGADHESLDATVAALLADESIAAAAPDVAISVALEANQSTDVPSPGWGWGTPPTGGNWGLELSRVPQMWNLNDALTKRGASVPIGVVDVGFSLNHPDLVYANTPAKVDTHGTHVAGIIGATFNNRQGIDGLNPYAQLTVASLGSDGMRGFSSATRRIAWGEMMHDGFEAVVALNARLEVVNMSLSYNWGHPCKTCTGINTNTSIWARTVADNHGFIFDAYLDLQALVSDLPILAVAAGNDSNDGFGLQQARWASPMCNAAIEHGNEHIIVVEAVALSTSSPGSATRSAFSNIGGQISAPGSTVVSTVWPGGYDALNGTSMAAPHVTGLIGYLLALDDQLTVAEIRDLLNVTGVEVGGGASKRIDAFAAALDIDRLRGNEDVLTLLCDIDDGSIDGNTRMDPAGSAVITSEDLDGDGGMGDKNVDMSDFRRWRDWLLQMEQPLSLTLDGPPSHLKFDVDRDSLVTAVADENVYPRGDFNGDGMLSRSATAHVPGAVGGERTDLAVFQQVFQDPDYHADDLPGLIDSGDLHIAADALLADPRVIDVEVTVENGAGIVAERVLTGAVPYTIVTVPSNGDAYTVLVEAFDIDGQVVGEELRSMGVPFMGEDLYWAPIGQRIALEVDFPDEIALDDPTPLTVRAGMIEASGDTTFAAGWTVLLGVDGGSVNPSQGLTDSDGRFTAEARVLPPASELSIHVTVRTPAGPERTTVVVAQVPGNEDRVRLTGNASNLAVFAQADMGDDQCSDFDNFEADGTDFGALSENRTVTCTATDTNCGLMMNQAEAGIQISYNHDPDTGVLRSIRASGDVASAIGGDFGDECSHNHQAGASVQVSVAFQVAGESIPVSVSGSIGPLTGDQWAIGGSIDVGFYSEFFPPGGMSVEQSGTLEPGSHSFDIRLSTECDSHDQALTGTFSVLLVFGE